MRKEILESIIKKRKTCYFISPHFDDAVLSAGALITYLSQHTKVVVINVFTKSGDTPDTISARTYLKQCGYTDAGKLYEDRLKEDALVFQNIVENIINLGFTEALWRRKYKPDFLSRLFRNIAEFQVIYPTYRYHIIKGVIAKQDKRNLEAIKKKLQEIIIEDDAEVFCPFGIGKHIDHVITRNACDELFPAVTYWSDFPYNLKDDKKTNGFAAFSFEENLARKHELVKGYRTQYAAMFGKGFDLKPEVFLSKNK